MTESPSSPPSPKDASLELCRDLAALPHEDLVHWMCSLVASSERAVAFVDDQWRIVLWSPRAAAMFGWNRETVLGKGITQVIGMTAEAGRALRLRSGSVVPVVRERLALRRAGGTPIDVMLSIHPLVPDRGGRVDRGALFTFQDDEASRVNQEFRKFFSAVDQSMVGALIANPGGFVEYANPRSAEVLGLSPVQLIGCSLFGRGDVPHGPEDCLGLLPEEVIGHPEWRGDRQLARGEGRDLTLYVVLSSVRDAAGRLVNQVVLFEDLTERRALERAERELRDSLAHAGRLAAIGEMATTIAHEINQPLAAISNYSLGSLRRLRGGDMQPAPIVGALTEISEQVTRASTIVRNIRRMARQQAVAIVPVDIDALLGQLLTMLRMSARDSRVTVELQSGLERARVMADDTQLSQIILNLARNGIEAMADVPEPRRRLLVAVALSPEQGDHPAARFTITDHGCGIADEHLSQIGTPFFTLKSDGLGLGLSITRTLLEAHGARLDVRRNPPGTEGMSFSFSLPLAIDAMENPR
jgi:two-component system, LuxR family, sensor histidine kinase DctS